MKNLNLEVKNFRNSDSIGTLEWTINQIKKMEIGISTLSTGKLCIGVFHDEKLTQIIAKEGDDYSKAYEGIRWFKEKDGELEYTYSSNESDPITYCYAQGQPEEYEMHGEVNHACLFADVLTPAALKLVDNFIEKCCYALIEEVYKRNDEELNRQIEITIK